MKRTLSAVAMAAVLFSVSALATEPPEPHAAKQVDPHRVSPVDEPKVQIALLLDTSSSMNGLINQAKEQLWRIVNTFGTAQHDGKRPRLEIALYEYGKSSLSAESGFIRQIVPLTTDLDLISEQLFALTTNGGNEYCGQVIQKATQQLQWSKNKRDLKLIYIAGNEPFTQGPVNYRTAIGAAVEHGIVVNTIHCGSDRDAISGNWRDAALLAKGSFTSIDHNKAVAQIDAPQDKELIRLGQELNKTYVGYGRGGEEGMARQKAQDRNAAQLSLGSASSRAVSKSTSFYDNSGWDLVDAKNKGKVEVEKMKAEDLPEEMRNMNAEQRNAHLERLAQEREAIQKKIRELSAERNRYLAEKSKERAAGEAATLDEAVIESAKAQGRASGYSF